MSLKNLSSKNIGFRVDASFKIGAGHAMRCLTLANKFKEHGANCHFYSRHMTTALTEDIKNNGHYFHSINTGLKEFDKKNLYESWLECSQEHDFNSFLRFVDKRFDILFIDHYALDKTWEERAYSISDKIFVIDDLANRDHACDYLLDQNIYENSVQRYSDKVNHNCKLLLGPSFSLLRPDFSELRRNLKSKSDINILVFYGGADPTSETRKFLEVLRENFIDDPFWNKIEIVIGDSNQDKEVITKLCKEIPKTSLNVSTPEMPKLISAASICFCAGGTFTWERFSLGLPGYVTTIAENQLEGATYLAKLGLICYLGHHLNVKKHHIIDALENVKQGRVTFTDQIQKIMGSVDGNGCEKIMNLVFGNENSAAHK